MAQPPTCPNCHQLLPDGNHPQDALVTVGGVSIPVIMCPLYTHDTLVIAPEGAPATILQVEVPPEVAPAEGLS
jgi:hypothetical protein